MNIMSPNILRLYIVPIVATLVALWFWYVYYPDVAWAPMVFMAIFLGQYSMLASKKKIGLQNSKTPE